MSSVSGAMFGAKKRTNGPIKRELWFPDLLSPEPAKMRVIHTVTGSQYLRNERSDGTAG